MLLLIILILYSFTTKDRVFRFESKFGLITGLVIIVLMCIIVIIDYIGSRFACTLI